MTWSGMCAAWPGKARVNARLVLIDRPELAALIIEHDRGVITEGTYTLKQVDENFFEGS